MLVCVKYFIVQSNFFATYPILPNSASMTDMNAASPAIWALACLDGPLAGEDLSRHYVPGISRCDRDVVPWLRFCHLVAGFVLEELRASCHFMRV